MLIIYAKHLLNKKVPNAIVYLTQSHGILVPIAICANSPASLRCGLWVRHIYPSLVLVQPRKTRPCLTVRLLMGRKESNQTNKQTICAKASFTYHDDKCNRTNYRGLMFGSTFHLHLYFVNVRSKGSGEPVHLRRLAWAFVVPLWDE